MNEVKSLSIIIPVFNVEGYLDRCLRSVLAAPGIENSEIILVDDGSKDKSGEIAESYAKKYEYIACYHINNAGPSEARNYGLSKSSGKYVCFFDSDDVVVPDVLSRIIRLIPSISVDIVLWDAEMINADNCHSKWRDSRFFVHFGLDENDGILTGEQIVEKQLRIRGDYPSTVWLGAYKREYLISNDLLFEVGILHEDELWGHKVLLEADSVIYVNLVLYHYCIRSGSLTHQLDSDCSNHIESLLYVFPSLYNYCDTRLSSDELRRFVKANLTKRYLYLIFEYDFCKWGFGDRVDCKELWNASGRIKDKIKVLWLVFKRIIYRSFRRRT